jgi:hypothetical protein
MGLDSFSNFDFATSFVLFATLCGFLLPVLILFPPVPVEKSDALRQTHSKIGLRPQESNLKDQFSSKHKPQDGTAPKIQSLYVYPVKSCRGIEVSESKVLRTGLEFDRLYSFGQLKSPFPMSLDMKAEQKDEHEWEFITQRQFPLLATVKVDVWVPDHKKKSRLLESSNEAFIVLRFPWRERGWRGVIDIVAAKVSKGLEGIPEKEILLPVDFPSREEIEERGYEYDKIRVWKEHVKALSMEKDLPRELQLYLGVSNKLGLFRINPEERREVFRAAPRKETAGYQPIIDFHDAVRFPCSRLLSIETNNWTSILCI